PHRTVTGANRQKRVATPDDGLIRVVSIHIQSAARKNPCQNVSGAGDALSVFASNPTCKICYGHLFSLNNKKIPFTRSGRKVSAKVYAAAPESARFLSAIWNFYCSH